jgi:hypothetical protein
MKQKDYALIIVIVFFSGIVSFFISGKIFVTPSNRQQKVQTVDRKRTTTRIRLTRRNNSGA